MHFPSALFQSKRGYGPDGPDGAGSDSDDDFEPSHLLLNEVWRPPVKSSDSSRISMLATLLCLAVGIIGYLSLQLLSTRSSPNLQQTAVRKTYGDCGSSVAEALANGCKFDITLWAWQRPECHDQELIDDFLSRTDWHFYSNWTLDAADELPLDQVAAGKYVTVYAEKKYHPIHCTASYRKLHRAIEGKLVLDHTSIPYSHTLHCEQILLMDLLHEVPCSVYPNCATKLDAIFAKCGYT